MSHLKQYAAVLLLAGVGTLPSVSGTASAQASSTKAVGSISISTNPTVPTVGVVTTVTAVVPTDATGLVAVLDGNELVGWAPAVNGASIVTLPSDKVPTHTLVAVYSGDDHYSAATTAALPSSSSARITFGIDGQAPMLMAVAPTAGHEAEFASYTVKLPDPSAQGLVFFVLDGALVGSGTISNGSVTLVRGIGTMHVVYTGDDRHTPVSL